jgi:hypothetical protein
MLRLVEKYLRYYFLLRDSFCQERDFQSQELVPPLGRERDFLALEKPHFWKFLMRVRVLVTFVSVVGRLYSPVLE